MIGNLIFLILVGLAFVQIKHKTIFSLNNTHLLNCAMHTINALKFSVIFFISHIVKKTK